MIFYTKKQHKGFTLIELLVVISIISLISSVVLSSLNSARSKARDAKRKQDMVQVRTALEMYYNDNKRYPYPNPIDYDVSGMNIEACGESDWGINGQTSGPNAYIEGLTPTYMKVLPSDPKQRSGYCEGYFYFSDGVNYKLWLEGVAESYPSAGKPFYDPVRPTTSWMICSGEPACSSSWYW